LQAKEIESQLKELIAIASCIEPALAYRLDQIRRWIKDIKPGSLTQKKVLMDFLLELIYDAQFWLDLKILTPEEREEFFDRIAPTTRYWYEDLFYKWFSERDRKFYTWKQKLRSGEFDREDAEIVNSIASQIESCEGTIVYRYVADLSMATDAIVSSPTGQPLCVQLTSMSDRFAQNKYEQWEKTLREWGIERGIFVSYNPGGDDFILKLVNVVLYNSKNLPAQKYLKFSF
jgi:hypothetical protein